MSLRKFRLKRAKLLSIIRHFFPSHIYPRHFVSRVSILLLDTNLILMYPQFHWFDKPSRLSDYLTMTSWSLEQVLEEKSIQLNGLFFLQPIFVIEWVIFHKHSG